MKTLLVLDELNQLHWATLKSVLLILSLLPMMQGAVALWQGTDSSSQIIIGFIVLSVFSAWFILCFLSALKISVWDSQYFILKSEQWLFKIYCYIPMLFLSSLVAYLSLEISWIV